RRTARWTTLEPQPVVLLGDAAHTAHFSVGSGTKMAMEDAIALAGALAAHPGDLPAALAAYEAAARPSVDAIQASARPSLSWWEHFGRYHDAFEPWQFAYHFLSRSITDARLARRDPAFVAATHRAWVQRYGAEPLDTPLEVGGTTLPNRRPERVPDGAAWVEAPADESGLPAATARVREAVEGGAQLVAVHGGAAFTRTLLCEEVRLVHGRTAVLVDPQADALTVVLSGRADPERAAQHRPRRGRRPRGARCAVRPAGHRRRRGVAGAGQARRRHGALARRVPRPGRARQPPRRRDGPVGRGRRRRARADRPRRAV